MVFASINRETPCLLNLFVRVMFHFLVNLFDFRLISFIRIQYDISFFNEMFKI